MPATATLFRYARLRRPRIQDLGARAARDGALAAVAGMDPDERAAWAAARLETHKGEALPELSEDYLALFQSDPLAGDTLPGPGDVQAHQRERLERLAASDALDKDRATALAHALALKIAGDPGACRAARLLQLLEHLPALADGAAQPARYAPAVLDRFATGKASAELSELPAEEDTEQDEKTDDPATDGAQLAEDIRLLWHLRHKALAAQRAEALRRETPPPARRPAPELADTPAQQDNLPRVAPDPAAAVADRRAQAERLDALRRANADRTLRLRALQNKLADTSLAAVAKLPVEELASAAPGLDPERIAAAQARVSSALTHMKPTETLSFCHAYEATLDKGDKDKRPVRPERPLNIGGCFAENPTMRFGDRIELMGMAELIRVEETFMGYSEAEISYVENILAGEIRVREVRSSKEFETIEENTEGETSVTSEETRATTGSELTKEVSTQLATRFNTDVSASASGSGGGTVGVVSFEGEGSLQAGFGLGVDSAMATNTASRFSSEIVETAAEQVTRTMQSRRLTRSRTLHETLNRHEINNTTGDEPKNRRGIYCFLDRHVCVTETPYGLRWFLKATVPLPGRNLMCERLVRMKLAMSDAESPPAFDLSPEDIHPSNYLALAGRYRAQGLAPPPPPLRRMGRTYKTDNTNETDVAPEGLEKIGQTLMPVFKTYKRHLVTDTLTIPDGYRLGDVRLMVNHGSNGVSVPVDLPLKATTAGLMTLPTVYAYGIFAMPMALWQVLMLASPLLYHNTDSSSVTATVGTEAQESHYYFFEADFLVQEILQLFGTFSALAPGIMQQIENRIAALPQTMNTQATEMAAAMTDAANEVLGAVQTVLTDIKDKLEDFVAQPSLDLPGLVQTFITAITSFTTSVSGITTTIPATLFGPLNDFIEEVVGLISEAAESAMSDMMAALVDASQNNVLLDYGAAAGATGEVPVALNVITKTPGVTVTLAACLVRTDEALDAWRLDTFGTLYQAYLQQLADYESRTFISGPPVHGKSPGAMREEERRSLREILIHALNGVHDQPSPPNTYTHDRINLFEHGIDWENISYRLYTYGPNLAEIRYDDAGVFYGADARRRAFLTAHWAQVMLPLPEDPTLEKAMLAYFESGATEIGADLTTDELTQLWADVINERSKLGDKPPPLSTTELVLPTDHVVLMPDDEFPKNPNTACAP